MSMENNYVTAGYDDYDARNSGKCCARRALCASLWGRVERKQRYGDQNNENEQSTGVQAEE